MRTEITSWQALKKAEREALAYPLGLEPESHFNSLNQAGRDSLVNIYYLLTSDKTAGNLWGRVQAIRWAGANQIGFEVDSIEEFQDELLASGHFEADGAVTLLYKKSLWSLRQVRIGDLAISTHGLQIYRPDLPDQPLLL